MNYYMIFTEKENGARFQDGGVPIHEELNVYPYPFDDTAIRKGGYFLCSEKYIPAYSGIGNMLADAEIPDDAVCLEMGRKGEAVKTDCVILTNFRPLLNVRTLKALQLNVADFQRNNLMVLCMAIRKKNADVVDYLLTQKSVNLSKCREGIVLEEAIVTRDTALIHRLISCGAETRRIGCSYRLDFLFTEEGPIFDLLCREGNGFSKRFLDHSLYICIHQEKYRSAKVLLSLGADISRCAVSLLSNAGQIRNILTQLAFCAEQGAVCDGISKRTEKKIVRQIGSADALAYALQAVRSGVVPMVENVMPEKEKRKRKKQPDLVLSWAGEDDIYHGLIESGMYECELAGLDKQERWRIASAAAEHVDWDDIAGHAIHYANKIMSEALEKAVHEKRTNE